MPLETYISYCFEVICTLYAMRELIIICICICMYILYVCSPFYAQLDTRNGVLRFLYYSYLPIKLN